MPRVKTDEAYQKHLQTLLASVEDISSVRITAAAASVVVYFAAEIPATDIAARVMPFL